MKPESYLSLFLSKIVERKDFQAEYLHGREEVDGMMDSCPIVLYHFQHCHVVCCFNFKYFLRTNLLQYRNFASGCFRQVSRQNNYRLFWLFGELINNYGLLNLIKMVVVFHTRITSPPPSTALISSDFWLKMKPE